MTSAEDLGLPEPLLLGVRSICCSLPDVVEELAWVGMRWRVRGRTFAHVLRIEDGKPAGYANAAATNGPAIVLMFRSAGEELEALRHVGDPFFAPIWRGDEVGLELDGDVDWDEVRELLTESYCVQAPAKLVAQVERPPDAIETNS